jgi:membrane-associated phospholipid phosphatase
LSAAVASHFTLQGGRADFPPTEICNLSWIDAAALFPYNDRLSKASLGLAGGALLWPALFALTEEKSQTCSAAVAYIEALTLAFTAKNLLKYALPRGRPYSYGSEPLDDELQDEAYESFPSGHATLAFCAATYAAALFLELAPYAPATPWIVAGGYGLALGTSVLRVASGCHFPTDVVAGALIGSGIGWFSAAAHLRETGSESRIGGEKVSAMLVPSSFLVKIAL